VPASPLWTGTTGNGRMRPPCDRLRTACVLSCAGPSLEAGTRSLRRIDAIHCRQRTGKGRSS
jgi:hypothetical protein